MIADCRQPSACKAKNAWCASCHMKRVNERQWADADFRTRAQLSNDYKPRGARPEWMDRLKLDEADVALLVGYRLKRAVLAGYERVRALHRASGKQVPLSHLLMQPPAGMVVDHINGDPLDNRRANLRVCTRAENSRNVRAKGGSSKFKGVTRYRHGWIAQILLPSGKSHLGVFKDEADAARAYDEKAREIHGSFAALNFPREGEVSCLRGV